jgi:hypothetical protein
MSSLSHIRNEASTDFVVGAEEPQISLRQHIKSFIPANQNLFPYLEVA